MVEKAPGSPNVGPQTAQVAMIHADEDNQTNCNVAVSDIEGQSNTSGNLSPVVNEQSAFKSLGWLDRYLAVWILLAIIIGILLGNFAPDAAAALDRGRFVGVSVPIGKSCCFLSPIHSTCSHVPMILLDLYPKAKAKKTNRKAERVIAMLM